MGQLLIKMAIHCVTVAIQPNVSPVTETMPTKEDNFTLVPCHRPILLLPHPPPHHHLAVITLNGLMNGNPTTHHQLGTDRWMDRAIDQWMDTIMD